MAEGPVVHYQARNLDRVLRGREVRVTFGTRDLKPFEPTFQGVKVQAVEAYGKQFRIRFDDGRIFLVHLMMWGSWRIYRKGTVWDKPQNRARLVLETDTHQAVAFSAPVVRLFPSWESLRDSESGDLGPDPLRPDFSREEFLRRLARDPRREIGEALLDQSVVAGVGNILRNEILFRAGIHPKRRISSHSERDFEALVVLTRELMANWLDGMRKAPRWIQVYRKSGNPCPRCGARIQFFRQAGRVTYACPDCQR